MDGWFLQHPKKKKNQISHFTAQSGLLNFLPFAENSHWSLTNPDPLPLAFYPPVTNKLLHLQVLCKVQSWWTRMNCQCHYWCKRTHQSCQDSFIRVNQKHSNILNSKSLTQKLPELPKNDSDQWTGLIKERSKIHSLPLNYKGDSILRVQGLKMEITQAKERSKSKLLEEPYQRRSRVKTAVIFTHF